MKVKCIEAKTPLLKIGKVYEVIEENDDCYKILDEYNGKRFYFKYKFEIVEVNKMRELTFTEVIANIKEGEVWESIYSEITKNAYGDIEVKWKESEFKKYYCFESNTKYKLQRKEYSFQEAFKAYEEGKEIESEENGAAYKIIDGKDKYYCKVNKAWMIDNFGFSMALIRSKWYIND